MVVRQSVHIEYDDIGWNEGGGGLGQFSDGGKGSDHADAGRSQLPGLLIAQRAQSRQRGAFGGVAVGYRHGDYFFHQRTTTSLLA